MERFFSVHCDVYLYTIVSSWKYLRYLKELINLIFLGVNYGLDISCFLLGFFFLFNNLFIFVSDKWCVEYHLWIMPCFINVHCDVYLYTIMLSKCIYIMKSTLQHLVKTTLIKSIELRLIDILEYMVHKLYNAQENPFSKQIFGIIQNWYIWLSLNIQQNRFKVISTTSRRKID